MERWMRSRGGQGSGKLNRHARRRSDFARHAPERARENRLIYRRCLPNWIIAEINETKKKLLDS